MVKIKVQVLRKYISFIIPLFCYCKIIIQQTIQFSIKLPVSWSSYGPGNKPCKGEGLPLLNDSKQILNSEECQISCDQTAKCNSIAWNSRNNNCYLKNKDDACEDKYCDWGRNDASDWNFYWKSCGSCNCILDFYPT